MELKPLCIIQLDFVNKWINKCCYFLNILCKKYVAKIFILSFNNLALYPSIPFFFPKSAFKTINFGSKFTEENLALMIKN